MTQSNIKQFSIFPDMPRHTPLVDKSGNMHELWQLYFDQLTGALQQNFKPEGIVVPPKEASDIALLTGNTSDNNIIYDSTNNVFKGNIAGTWMTFTLT